MMNNSFKKLTVGIITGALILQIFSPLYVFAQTGLLDPETDQPVQEESSAEPAGQIYDANAGKYVPINQANQEAAKAQASVATKGIADQGVCSPFTNFLSTRCFGWIMMAAGGYILGIGGTFLNFSIETSILNMKQFVDKVGAINLAWKTFRDLANIFFIFILIYIAMKTILGFAEGQTWKLLRNVILVALFINFSLFFTKVVIDASNIVTVQFYNSITKGPSASENGLSYVFLEGSRLKTLYAVRDSPNSFEGTNYLMIGFMSLIFFTILAFCFVAIGLLFLIRLAIFFMLMILSPLAFLGHTIPDFSQAWGMYWKNLLKQAIFAPFMMAIIWMVAAIINSPAFINAMGVSATAAANGVNFANAFSLENGSAMMVVINFAILIILLIAGMITSQQFAAYGQGKVIDTFGKWSKKVALTPPRYAAQGAARAAISATAATGRQTAGRLGNYVSKLPGLEKLVASNNFAVRGVASGVQAGAQKVAQSSFDVRGTGFIPAALGKSSGTGGYQKGLAEKEKEETAKAKSMQTKVYADEKTEERVKQNQKIIADEQKNIANLQGEIRTIAAVGGDTAKIKTALAAAIGKRDAAAKEIKEIDEDRSKTTTTGRLYAQNTDTIFNRMLSVAQRKTRSAVEKEYEKGDAAWKNSYPAKKLEEELTRVNAKFAEDLNNLNSNARLQAEYEKKTAEFTEQIAKNQEILNRRDENKRNNVVDVNTEMAAKKLEEEKEQTTLATRRSNYEEQLALLKTDQITPSASLEVLRKKEEGAIKEQIADLEGKKKKKENIDEALKVLSDQMTQNNPTPTPPPPTTPPAGGAAA